MKILFLGVGSIGSLFGGLLSKKFDVWLIGRDPHISSIKENGLFIISKEMEEIFYPKASTKLPIDERFDCLVITTKTFDLEFTLRNLKRCGFPSIPILILQNGLNNEKIVEKYFPRSMIMRAITTEGANIIEPGKVSRSGYGRTFIGNMKNNQMESSVLTNLTQGFSDNGLKSTLVENINKWIWGKLLINSVINPICALIGCQNGFLLQNKNLTELLDNFISEISLVVNTSEIYLPFKDVSQEVKQVIFETTNNYCSMLQDLKKKKPTEIDFLNGALLKHAQNEKIETPINDTLVSLLLGRVNAATSGIISTMDLKK